jgi:hypothetical protein
MDSKKTPTDRQFLDFLKDILHRASRLAKSNGQILGGFAVSQALARRRWIKYA